jgi:hypothetical protein
MSPGMTYASLLTDYGGQLSKQFAVELNPGSVFSGPRDYAVMANAIVFWSGSDSTVRNLVMGHLDKPAPIFGWGDASPDEGWFIRDVGSAGDFYIASDWARDLSTLSSLSPAIAPQEVTTSDADRITYDKSKNYITFIMSDGDNVQWTLNRSDDVQWWGSKERGKVPMGWTISPSLFFIATPVWNYLVGSATSKDEFVAAPSGIGYIFGDIVDEHGQQFQAQLEDLQAFLNASGVEVVSIFGDSDWRNTKYLDGFVNLEGVKGAFYFEFAGWIPSQANSETQWFTVGSKSKPVIPTNEYLGGSDNVSGIVADICNGNKNDGVYAVYLNAWADRVGSQFQADPMIR